MGNDILQPFCGLWSFEKKFEDFVKSLSKWFTNRGAINIIYTIFGPGRGNTYAIGDTAMIRYIKCPRCELNYIDADRQEYCDVCIAEMKGSRLQFADLDEDDYGILDEELEEAPLCPVCKINRLRPGESICEECRAKQEYEGEDDNVRASEDEDLDEDHEDEWQRYLDEEDDEDLTVEDEKIKEELDAEFGSDEDEDFKDDYVDDSESSDEGTDKDEEEYDPYLDGDLGDFGDDDEDDDEDDEDSESDDDF